MGRLVRVGCCGSGRGFERGGGVGSGGRDGALSRRDLQLLPTSFWYVLASWWRGGLAERRSAVDRVVPGVAQQFQAAGGRAHGARRSAHTQRRLPSRNG